MKLQATEDIIVSVHENAMRLSLEIQKCEAKLILALQKVDELKVYQAYKYPSLFKYVTLGLGFSEQKAYSLITVSRAARKFEKLAKALREGGITVSKAKKIVPVLKPDNQDEWLLKAHLNTHRNLEVLVAGENPEVILDRESLKPISAGHFELKITITLEEYNHIKRAQDLLCQKRKKHVSLKNTVMTTTHEYINKMDPVVKAARAMAKAGSGFQSQTADGIGGGAEADIGVEDGTDGRSEKSRLFTGIVGGIPRGISSRISRRIPRSKPRAQSNAHAPTRRIEKAIFHQVQSRDQGRCQFVRPDGRK